MVHFALLHIMCQEQASATCCAVVHLAVVAGSQTADLCHQVRHALRSEELPRLRCLATAQVHFLVQYAEHVKPFATLHRCCHIVEPLEGESGKVGVLLRADQDVLAIFNGASLKSVNIEELYKIVAKVAQGHFQRSVMLACLFGQHVDIFLLVHDFLKFLCVL